MAAQASIEPIPAARDTAFVLISRGPLDRLEAYRKRLGWSFRWVSSAGSDFNFDFGVSFVKGSDAAGPNYNYGSMKVGGEEMPGISAFRRGDDGAIYHTYSSYGRGGEGFLGVYAWLDIAPLGRQEASGDMKDWMRRHDSYDGDGRTRPPAPTMPTAN